MTEKTARGNALLRGERLQIMLEAEEVKVLDDFRFHNRLPSRAAAVRELLRRGLLANGFDVEQQHVASHAFGVLGRRDARQADNSDHTGSNGIVERGD